MNGRDMSPTFEDALGVHATQAKVNVGPVQSVNGLELNSQGVLVDFGSEVCGALGAERLRNVDHM